MSARPPEPDLRDIWQNQEKQEATMSIEDVRLKAQTLIRENRRDRIARSAFAVIAAVFCGIVSLNAGMGAAGVIAGLVMAMLLITTVRSFYLSHLRSRESANAALTSCLEFYRQELEMQREFARQPAWQLVIALLILAWLIHKPVMRAGMDSLRVLLPIVLFAAAGLIVLMAVRKLTARVQDDIEALDRFEEGSHDSSNGE